MGMFDDIFSSGCSHDKIEVRGGWRYCKDCHAKLEKVNESEYSFWGFADPSKAPGESGGTTLGSWFGGGGSSEKKEKQEIKEKRHNEPGLFDGLFGGGSSEKSDSHSESKSDSDSDGTGSPFDGLF